MGILGYPAAPVQPDHSSGHRRRPALLPRRANTSRSGPNEPSRQPRYGVERDRCGNTDEAGEWASTTDGPVDASRSGSRIIGRPRSDMLSDARQDCDIHDLSTVPPQGMMAVLRAEEAS